MPLSLCRAAVVAAALLASFRVEAQGAAVHTPDNAICPPAAATMGPPPPAPPPRFCDATSLDYVRLLAAPPALGSVAAVAELEVVRQVQAARTPAQVEWAQTVDLDCVFNLAEILGPWFRRDRLPATDAFFQALTDDIRAVDRASKAPFQRARPYNVDPTIRPCVRLSSSTSYPSGTALQEYLWAELIAEIFPEKEAALLARAQRAAWGRVLAGVHFPSDLEAGRRLVPPFLAECRKNASFRAAFERCRTELGAVSKTK
jgi:acid phosphatase (class A)